MRYIDNFGGVDAEVNTLDLLAASACGILGGMGVGSGGLFMIYLLLVRDMPQLTAQGLNLYFFLFSAGASLTVHMQKRKIFWSAVLLMIFVGSVGTLAGSLLCARLSANLLRRAFGGMLVFCGIASLYSVIRTRRTKNLLENKK